MSTGISTKDKTTAGVAFAVLVLIIFVKVLLYPLGDLDELWNYNLCRGVSMGYVPYRDFSMVMMPLFTVLFSFPLHLSRTLLVYRVCSALFFIVTAVVYYRVAVKITDRLIGRFITLMVVFAMSVATYNWLLFLCLMIVYIFLRKELSARRAVVIGSVCSLAILCRQTSGVFLMIAVMLIFLIDPSLRKFFGWLMAGCVGVMGLFAACLLITGSFKDFWDCCLFALIYSGHNVAYSSDLLPPVILIVTGIAIDLFMWIKKHRKDHLYHLVLGIVLVTVGIPIVDYTHICCAGFWFVIPIGGLINDHSKKFIKPVLVNGLTVAAGLSILGLSIAGALGMVTCDKYPELAGIPMYDGYIDGFSVIDEANRDYRDNGQKVVILSNRACIFSIMDDRFDPPFDLFLTGNTGTKNPVTIVEEVCSQPDTLILIPDDYQVENWENPEGVYEYVVDNCIPVSQYGNFYWYEPVR